MTAQLQLYAYHVTSMTLYETGDVLSNDKYTLYHGVSLTEWTQISSGVWNVTDEEVN